ncbi:MAG: hypothetical protein AAF560_13270 [Acidobacteriota bacterium]
MRLDELNADIERDQQGRLRRIDHSLEPYTVEGAASNEPAALAAHYIETFFEIERVQAQAIDTDSREERRQSPGGLSELWLESSQPVRRTSVVEFGQTLDGIPVWRRGLSVLLRGTTGEVLEATSTFEYDLPEVDVDAARIDDHIANLNEAQLGKLLMLESNQRRLETIQDDLRRRGLPIREDVLEGRMELAISRRQSVVFPYRPEERQHSHHDSDHDSGDESGDPQNHNLVERLLDFTLPPVDGDVTAGSYRVATEVLFSLRIGELSVNWHAMIDVATDSVLYLRALIDMATASGYVYLADPVTATGDPTIVPSSPAAVLNGPRTPRSLATAAVPDLSGQYVRLEDTFPIPAAPPTAPTGRFDFDANTDDFAAVNAYYHSDAVFSMVEEMGFDMATYFDGTTFPVPVDHRGSAACVNAAAWGNAGNDGLGSFTYGLVEAGQPIGIATDKRVVLHEFGHAILWDNVHSPNFGFAHSCGDSLAAVLCDPQSQAPDRFLTFPWIPAIDRRHDRDVTAGWAWGGVNDDRGYRSEQILATSHFRAYRALGGDHPDLCEREWAARYLAYLIIHAVGTLTPATNPANPEAWSERLQLCDRITRVFEGHAGGAVHKVIRWAFEQQGAYQLPGTPRPITSPGAPPLIDLYIDDGRRGEYGFTHEWCQTQDIWNRCEPDCHPAHQAPIPGVDNYAYVIVRNRGTGDVENATVRAFHKRDDGCCGCCHDCADLTWPSDFEELITNQLNTGQIPRGSYTIVGPFIWRPRRGDCLLMAVEHRNDPSNLRFIRRGETLKAQRLVPFDNNIALRCLCKQCNPDYSKLEARCPPAPIDVSPR